MPRKREYSNRLEIMEVKRIDDTLTLQRGVTGSARIAKTLCTAHHMQALILSLISRQQMESNCNWAAL
jgi:hypothetical protein